MKGAHRSASQLWASAKRKLFPRGDDDDSHFLKLDPHCHSYQESVDSTLFGDYQDGFYKYSQELLQKRGEESYNRLAEEMGLRSSGSTAVSYASAQMVPIERPSLPYTIGHPDWSLVNGLVRFMDSAGNEDLTDWVNSVMNVYTKVYSIAKFVVVVFYFYNVDLDDNEGLLAHIRRAEELVAAESIKDLVRAVETLYYALYSRLVMEIANAELCSYFHLGIPRVSTEDGFMLPEQHSTLNMLLVCKEALDSPTVCTIFSKDILRQHQAGLVRRAVNMIMATGFSLDDLVGYRRYTLALLEDRASEFRRKWDGPGLTYQMPPKEVLILGSEKFMSFAPRDAIRTKIPQLHLSFLQENAVDPAVWEQEVILGHRQAVLAILESRVVGEIRHADSRRDPIIYARQRRCTCRSACSCAVACTMDPERICPCAGWNLTIMLLRDHRYYPNMKLGDRCIILAKAIFEAISTIRKDEEDLCYLAVEMRGALTVIADEVYKQRAASGH
ncbi:uncharacterized protein BO97DRAFT_443484 [Aspergillus homomorphus CBS 101889]|uniref:Uncharacterized protein n=1 Tax=Aspergillus homomorphus (strain CBS 101889) TaxID=1450537 RepID=A0A395HX75_ASPHC|nr:hypothetical protein BO97DRAFT_443484 [Aspergillus homomorphus CBS 101889]RAL12099.1 hypothetical protein BO97DRAFT_443484 [Aspergillus homomorphus CBS 101889]